jgi:hypothetical protein
VKNITFILICLLIIAANQGLSQTVSGDIVPVSFRAVGFQEKEITIRIKDSVAYLPAVEVFDYLGIRARYNPQQMLLQGFYKNQDSTYAIDVANRNARLSKKRFPLYDEDFIIDDNTLFLRIDFINEFFGLDFAYNPRILRVSLRSTRNLPAYQYQQLVRRNQSEQIRGITDIPDPDITFDRDYYITGAGLFNYTVSSRITSSITNSVYNFYLGSKVLGNDLELTAQGFYSTKHSRDPIIHGMYRIPILNSKYLTQIIAGRVYNPGLFPLDVYSLEFTNRPLATRYIQSRDLFTDQLIPNANLRIIGMYSGLIPMQTDTLGNFAVDLPTLYGKGDIEIQATDRYGQLDIVHYQNNVPYKLLPSGETEYSVFFGKVYNVSNRYLSVNSVNYGVSSKFTVGGRLEYYKLPMISQNVHAALTTVGRITDGLYVDGLVSPNAYSEVGLNWLPMTAGEISLRRAWYSRNYRINYFSIYDKWEALINIPFFTRSLRLNTYGSRYQYKDYHDYSLSTSLRGLFRKVSASIGTRITWRTYETTNTEYTPYHISNATLESLLPLSIFFQTQITYDHIRHELQSIGFDVTRIFFKRLHVNVFYQRFPVLPRYYIGLSLRYYFPFMTANAKYTYTDDGQSYYNAYVKGSVIFDIPERSVSFSNRTYRGSFGGFRVRPFFDENNNNIRDAGEEYIEKGRMYIQNKTLGLSPVSLARNVFTSGRLLPYNEFSIYLDPRTLENPLLVPRYSSVRILSESNYIRDFDIPVVHSGTVRGSVTLSDSVNIPIEGISVILSVKKENGDRTMALRKVMTFSTGEFEIDLLPPGNYIIQLEPSQLQLYNFTSQPTRRDVVVRSIPDGDIVEGVNFILIRR